MNSDYRLAHILFNTNRVYILIEFCVSLCGRKRWFPLICSSDYQTKTSLERQAINFVIQGTLERERERGGEKREE